MTYLQAQYCIKMTGIFEGKLGTKRFCSSRDWGHYCEYIKRPGDIQVGYILSSLCYYVAKSYDFQLKQNHHQKLGFAKYINI